MTDRESTLTRLQEETARWHAHNFPAAEDVDVFLVIVEEVGELAQAIVKPRDGIRGTVEHWDAEAQDAVGDVVIALSVFCAKRGYDMENIVRRTWAKVSLRDWQADPERGGRDDL